MNILKIAARLPDYAADIKQNIIDLFSSLPDGLTEAQLHGVALTAAYLLKNERLLNDIRAEAKLYLEEKDANACKIAVVTMALTNAYYECINECKEGLDAFDGNLDIKIDPGVNELDFALYCLAASTLHRSASGIKHHTKKLLKLGVSKSGIKSVAHIVAVLQATTEALDIESVRSYEFVARQSSM